MAGLTPEEQRAITRENIRLASTLRHVRRGVRRALTEAERAASREPDGRFAGVVSELQAVLADTELVARRRPEGERQADGRTEGEEKGRMLPRLGEVIDELRRRDK